jgi:hypothetical protein
MNKLVRVSLHLEKIKKDLELSYTESRALFAVQMLLSDTDYKGNTKPEQFTDDVNWKYKGELPGLKISVSEYLDAYGVNKYKTKRNKMEYSGTERKTATGALERLAQRNFLFKYERTCWEAKKNSSTKETIEVTAPLMVLQKSGRNYIIYPSPILVDQIDTYFLWKPRNLFDKIGGKDTTSVLFMDYLFTRAEQARSKRGIYTIKLEQETIAKALRLDKLIETRQWLRIRSRLNDLYEQAKELGYLSSYLIDQNGVKSDKIDVLTLNKETFKNMRKKT